MFQDFFGVKAQVFLPGRQGALQVGEHGILEIPGEVTPRFFHLVVLVPREARVTFAQKDVGTELGEYDSLIQKEGRNGHVLYRPAHPIEVKRVGKNVWTSWHQQNPNRVDCWYLGETGELQLFQIGVITHDDGKTFRLLGEPRWGGQLFRSSTGYIPKPGKLKWGPLGTSRYPIFVDHGFQWLLSGATLPTWNGRAEEVDLPLSEIPPGNHARVDWYVPFAGQTGQGIAKLRNGGSAWVHGSDVQEDPDPDGIKRVFHNELVSFEGEPQQWGTKKDAPPKLVGVRRVRS